MSADPGQRSAAAPTAADAGLPAVTAGGGARGGVDVPAVPLLEVAGLWVRFGRGEGQVQAVNGLSYALSGGSTLAIIGESGSGKTVSARALMGLLPETAAVGGLPISMGRICWACRRRRCAPTGVPVWRWCFRTRRGR